MFADRNEAKKGRAVINKEAWLLLDPDGIVVSGSMDGASIEHTGHSLKTSLPQDLCNQIFNWIRSHQDRSGCGHFLWPLNPEKAFDCRIVPLPESRHLIFLQNVTQIHQTEANLRLTKERFELASRAVNSAIYDWDIDAGTITWTDGLTEVLGYSPPDSITVDQWWIDRIHPDDQSQVLQQISSRLNHAEDFVSEYRFLHQNGEYRIVLDRGRLLHNDQGRVCRVVGSIMDVTVQRNSEKAIIESEKRYRGLVETMHEMVFEIDTEGIIRFVNPQFLSLTHYEGRQIIGSEFFQFLHPEERDSVTETMLTVIRNGTVVRNSEWRFRSRDGNYRHLLNNLDPHYGPDGKIIGVLLISFDITERKEEEETLLLMVEAIAAATEADDFRMMISRCLEVICRLRGWQIGQAWFPDEKYETIFCSHSFSSESEFSEFRSESVRMKFPKGRGLPGEAWETCRPVWFEDLASHSNFKRSEIAQKSHLSSGFAFPLMHRDKTLAIFEFFSTEPRPEDDNLLRIVGKLGHHLAVILERKREQEKIKHQAYHDILTGLPNRMLLEDRFTQSLAHARRHHQVLAVLFLDLDQFKAINDKLGHTIGDLLLQEMAQRLARNLRSVDTIARLGGDEFVVLLPEIPHIEDAAKVAQKILTAVEVPFRLDDHEIHMTTSIGISLFPHDGDDLQTLMKNADTALYRSKEKGRNNYQLYTPMMTVAAQARLKLEKDLRLALDRNEFLLHFQPQLDLRSGRVFGAEALLRWQHPELGLFLPAEFLAIAEESGLVLPIWEWALKTACLENRKWQEAGIRSVSVTMNIPVLQFESNLTQVVAEILRSSRLERGRLDLEITEKVTTQPEFATSVLRELKELGIGIALDDFGTGNSALIHLKQLPIDRIKVDPYFIRDLTNDTGNQAIVSAIISLAHGLGMTVLAEGVESESQITLLKSMHCDAIQGFFLSRPLPSERFIEWLRRESLF